VLRPVIESLLEALEAGGAADSAAARRTAFDARGWENLTKQDVDGLLALIGQGVEDDASGVADTPVAGADQPLMVLEQGDRRPQPCSVPSQATTDLPRGPWSPEDDYGAFVDGLSDGRALLRAAQGLATADTFDAAVDAARTVFADLLGFEAADLDQRRRIGGQTIREHRVVARYGRFTVSVVAYAYPWSWPTVAAPVFRLHPQGFVIGVAPGWSSVRFFVRLVRGGDAGLIRFRTMTGWSVGRDALDNLVVWTGRLAGLRPQFGDDEAALMERAQKRLLCDPADLAHGWRSSPLDEAARPPGVPWTRIGRRGEHGFLQPAPGPRWFWGLQRVLVDRFPLSVGPRDLGCRIRFTSYEVADSDSPRLEDALATSRTWRRPLVLHLEVEFPGGGLVPVEVEAAVPRCTSDGRFVINGRWYRFGPSVGQHGRLVTGRLDQIDDLDDDYLELFDEGELPSVNPATSGIYPSPLADAPDDTDPEEEEEAPKVEEDGEQEADWDGGSIGSLLEVAVTRKLSAIVRRALKLPADAVPVEAFLNIVRALSGDEGLFLLTSKRFLLAALRPVADSPDPGALLTTVRSDPALEPGFVPSWACLDASAGLPAREWFPVEGARLTPWAGLAVPGRRDGGPLSLGFDPDPATSINPRTGTPDRGPSHWWIADGLQEFALLPAGRVAAGASVLAEGSRLRRFFGATVPGEELRVLLDPDHLAGLERRIVHLVQRIPFRWSPGEDQDPVELTVTLGSVVGPGTTWLRAPKGLWNRADRRVPETGPERWLLDAILGQESGGQPARDDGKYATWRWSVPHGIAGTVVAASLEPVRLPGGTQVSWLARLEIRSPPVRVNAVLRDGRSVLVEELLPADAPYGAGGGEPATVVIEDPSASTDWNDQVWFDGRSGDFFEGAELVTGPLFLVPDTGSLSLEGPDWSAPRRLLDGGGIPLHPRAVGLPTWLSNYWAGADPAGHSRATAANRGWSGGHAPWEASLRLVNAAHDCSTRVGGVERSDWACTGQPWDRQMSVREEGPRLSAPSSRWSRSRGEWVSASTSSSRFPRPWSSPTEYRCECGELASSYRLFAECSVCETDVVLRRVRAAPQHPFIELPELVPHPWRLAGLGALLGLTGAEVASDYVSLGPDPLLSAAGLAADQPWDRLDRRMVAVEGRENRLNFAPGMVSLREELAREPRGRLAIERFFVWRVPVLPPALATAGMPARAPALMDSALARSYRRLSAVVGRHRKVAGWGGDLLLELARHQLLESLQHLFGTPDADPGTENLGALAKRLLPPTRPPGLRDVPYGLIQRRTERPPHRQVDYISSPMPAEAPETQTLQRSSISLPGGDVGSLAVVLVDGVAAVPNPEPTSGSAASPHFWAERDARPRFFRKHLPLIATIVGGLDDPGLSTGGGAAIADLRQRLGPLWSSLGVISNLFRASGRSESQVGAFVAALEAPLPRPLAADVAEAKQAVRGLIDPAFPGEGPELESARSLLAEVLVGWWSVPPDRTAPYGWAWLGPHAKSPHPTARRRMPPVASPAWRSWPGVEAVLATALALADGVDVGPLSWHPWLRLASGLPVQVPESVAHAASLEPVEAIWQQASHVPTVGSVSSPSRVEQPVGEPNGIPEVGEGPTVSPQPVAEPIEVDSASEPVAPKGVVAVTQGAVDEPLADARVLRSSLRTWLAEMMQGDNRVE